MKLLDLPLSQLQEPAHKLRPVLKDTEEYKGLVDSIKKVGILNAILVRQIENLTNPDVDKYEVIEGNHRFNASLDAGKETIPVQVLDMDDQGVYDAQIIGNIHKIETKHVEYAKQLKGILARERGLTSPELATRLGKSSTWLNQRLSLGNLLPEIGVLVDEGQIGLSNAYKLADLDQEDQLLFKDRAISEKGDTFFPAVVQHIKQKKEALRQGADPDKAKQFVANPHMRKIKDVEAILAGPDTTAMNKIIADANAATPLDAVAATMKWVLHLDPSTLEAAKAKWENDEKEKAALKAKLAEEKAAKKAADDAAKALKIV